MLPVLPGTGWEQRGGAGTRGEPAVVEPVPREALSAAASAGGPWAVPAFPGWSISATEEGQFARPT